MRPTLCPNDSVLVDYAAYCPGNRSLLAFPLGGLLRVGFEVVESVCMSMFGARDGAEDRAWLMPTVGDVIVCHHPTVKCKYIIKRVGSVTTAGPNRRATLTLYGDNTEWGESQLGNGLFGTVPLSLVVGKVVAHVPHSH